MIWLFVALLLAAALMPLIPALRRRSAVRGTRDLAVALHRGQLAELDRDLAEGRILPSEHATAVLEVQRRLLAVADRAESGAASGSLLPVLAVIVLVPLAALGLYSIGGSPGMPSMTGAATQARIAEEDTLIEQLRQQLRGADPATERGWQGFVLLGNAEAARGNEAAAAAAWQQALHGRFDPDLAARTAEAMARSEGVVGPASAALFRQALAASPAAPWRGMAEQRLREAP